MKTKLRYSKNLPKDIEYDVMTRIELLQIIGLSEKEYTSEPEYDIMKPLKF